MDRAMLTDHLQLAEQHIATGEHTLTRQRKIVAELDRDGHGTVLARDLLAQFEKVQARYIADRDRLRRELAALSQLAREWGTAARIGSLTNLSMSI